MTFFNPETPNKDLSIDVIRYRRLDQGKKKKKGEGQQGNRKKWKWEPGKEWREHKKNLLDFRKQWSAIHHTLHLYCTQFIKHFHIMAFHVEAPDCLIANLDIAQHILIQMNFLLKIIMKILAYGKE